MNALKAMVLGVIVAFVVACSSFHSHYSQRIVLITNPAVNCVLLTNIDSIAKLLAPVFCGHKEGCSMGYYSVDTTFAIGFTLNILRSDEDALDLLKIEARNFQIERTDLLDIPLVEGDGICGNCAYGYYTYDTPLGLTSYFFGVVVSNGYSVGVSYQLVNAEQDQFTKEGLALLQGVRVEPHPSTGASL